VTRRGRPSPAQRRVLEAIASGGWLSRAHRGDVWDHFPTNRLTVVQGATVRAMNLAGWLDIASGTTLGLTPLGKAALEDQP